MNTALAEREMSDAPVALFNGASPADVIVAATEAANQLADVVKQRKLFKRIGTRDHILVEGWQTLGTLVGVFAVKDGGVRELEWPALAALGEEPEDQRTAAWAAWTQHRALLAQHALGRAYGYSAAYKAVKDGREVGWGEGRCNRGEKMWMDRDDYALASMAQTRGQGRTLRQPLGFIVHLAGYATTPAEEMPDVADATPALPYGPEGDASADAAAVAVIEGLYPINGAAFVRFVNQQFGTEHLPAASARMVHAIQWALGDERMRRTENETSTEEP